MGRVKILERWPSDYLLVLNYRLACIWNQDIPMVSNVLLHINGYIFSDQGCPGESDPFTDFWETFKFPPITQIRKPYSEVCPINWHEIQNMKQHKWNDMDKQSVIGCLWSISESWADRTGAFYVYNHVLRQPSVTTVALNHDNMIIATHVTTQWNNYHLI